MGYSDPYRLKKLQPFWDTVLKKSEMATMSMTEDVVPLLQDSQLVIFLRFLKVHDLEWDNLNVHDL